MGFVSAKEIAKVLKIDKFGLLGQFFGWSVLQVMGVGSLNRFYDKTKDLPALEFIDGLLDEFDITFEIPEEDLNRIPKSGPFITVSNHPLGAIDGVLLLKILSEKRPDFKVMGNFLLHRVAPLKPLVMRSEERRVGKECRSWSERERD